MKRSTIWGLAITLVLGCWVGSASARPLAATESLLVPYYEARGNLATLIGVQHIGPQTNGVSIINVAVHDTDGGVAAGGYICLGPDEFGYVVLQNAQPPLDEDFGIYFSVARDAIDRTGFVGLAYAGYRNSCSDGAGTTAVAGTVVACHGRLGGAARCRQRVFCHGGSRCTGGMGERAKQPAVRRRVWSRTVIPTLALTLHGREIILM